MNAPPPPSPSPLSPSSSSSSSSLPLPLPLPPPTSAPLSLDECLHIRTHSIGCVPLSYSSSSTGPLLLSRGEGCYLYGAGVKELQQQGKGSAPCVSLLSPSSPPSTYLDVYNNVATCGHSSPAVYDAVSRQLLRLNTNPRYLSPHLPSYASRLLSLFPPPLSLSSGSLLFLTASGAEANDLALRVASSHLQSPSLLAFKWGYHGATTATALASHYKRRSPGMGKGIYAQEQRVEWLELPDIWRGKWRVEKEEGEEGREEEERECVEKYLQEARETLQRIDGPVTFIHESIVGCGGQLALPPSYLSSLYSIIRSRPFPSVIIADEVQTLFRTGTLLAFEHDLRFPPLPSASAPSFPSPSSSSRSFPLLPDIVTLGKGLANGFPFSAVICRSDVASSFACGRQYFSTFGGADVSIAAAAAVLEEVERGGWMERAREVGEWMKRELRAMRKEYGWVGEVRGRGLFLGVDIIKEEESNSESSRAGQQSKRSSEKREPDGEMADRIVNDLLAYKDEESGVAGMLLGTDGEYGNVIKIKPPLVFGRAEAHILIRGWRGVNERIKEEKQRSNRRISKL